MKTKLSQLEKQNSEQKISLVSKILNLKEKEFDEKQTCRCRGWCAINHQKHSWKISRSKTIFTKLKSMDIHEEREVEALTDKHVTSANVI